MAPAERLVHGVVNLSGGPSVRLAAVGNGLRALPPEEALVAIDELLRAPGRGWREGTEVLSLLGRVLLDGAFESKVQELDRLAGLTQMRAVNLYLTEAPAVLEYELDAAQRADAKVFSEPLGRLKTQARLATNADAISRFATASNASVIRELLINPRLTEALVVRIASRRPARPEPLREIALSTNWGVQAEVRRSLVFNPYLPPVIGSKLVPLAAQGDLRMLATDPNVHESLRSLARLLLQP